MRDATIERAFWTVAVLGLVGVTGGVVYGAGVWGLGLPETYVTPRGEHLEVVWVGDTMLADAVQDSLDAFGYGWPLQGVREATRGDFLVANLEAPITTRTEPFDPSQFWSYSALPPAADALAEFGVGALGIANNHAMDRGPEGLRETFDHVARAGILAFGAGMNEAEAERPLILRSPVGTVGIVGLGKYYGPTKMAALENPGTIALSPASIRRGYRLAKRAGADWVVGFVHWGSAYTPVDDDQRRFARMFAEEGYTMVIGSHAHIAQPIEVIDGMPVAYSLGNFVFGSRGRHGAFGNSGMGLAIVTEFSPRGLERLVVRCMIIDNRRVAFRPRQCTDREAAELLPELNRDLEVRGYSGTLHLRGRPADPSR